MLSYPIPEAEMLLETKLKTAQSSLANCEEDLDFLREQITVSIVSIGNAHTMDGLANDIGRLWRLPRQGSTTGTSCNAERKRLQALNRKAMSWRKSQMDDRVALRWFRRVAIVQRMIMLQILWLQLWRSDKMPQG